MEIENKSDEIKDAYFLTVTLKPYTYKESIKEQFKLICRFVGNCYNTCYFNTSVVELTKNYNLHLHSIVKIREDEIEKLVRVLYNVKYFGFHIIKPVDDIDELKRYLEKDQFKMWTQYGINSVLTDDYNLYKSLPERLLQWMPLLDLKDEANDSDTSMGVAP